MSTVELMSAPAISMSICGFCRLHGSLVARSLKRHRWGNQLHRNRYKQPEPPYAHKKLCCAAAAVQEALPSTSAANGRQAKPAFRVNLDWKYVKDNVEALKANAASRNSAANPALVAQLYDEWREQENEAEELRTQRNANAKKMKVLISSLQGAYKEVDSQVLVSSIHYLAEQAECGGAADADTGGAGPEGAVGDAGGSRRGGTGCFAAGGSALAQPDAPRGTLLFDVATPA